MGRKVGGIRLVAALAAMLQAVLVIHIIHPYYHYQGAPVGVDGVSQSYGGGLARVADGAFYFDLSQFAPQTLTQMREECPICRFLVFCPSHDTGPGPSVAAPEWTMDASAPSAPLASVPSANAPSNARAPPAAA
jgi:hypothetical protein